MAIQLKLDYSKKLGLPQFSSHQFSVAATAEVSDASQIHAEVERLYAVLQAAVDTQIVRTGYMPGTTPDTAPVASADADHAWACSDKQRDLILGIVDRHHLDKQAVETLAKDRFGLGVRQLNKLQASGLIDELMETYGEPKPRFQSARTATAPRRTHGFTPNGRRMS